MVLLFLNGLALGVLLLVLSSGLALIFGLRDVVNFAHGAMYMFAAYLSFSVSSSTSFWVALVFVPLVFAAAGVLLDRYGIRYLRDRDHLDMILVTFGLMYVLTGAVQTVWGTQPRSITPPSGLDGTTSLLGTSYPTYRVFVVVLGLVVAAALVLWLRRSTTGLYVRAATDYRHVANAVGIDVDKVSATVVAVGMALAGLGGVLAGPYLSLSTDMGVNILVLSFIVVVTGGLGSIGGAMGAAILLGMLNSFSANHLPGFAAYVPYALMLTVLLFWPSGLAGRRAV